MCASTRGGFVSSMEGRRSLAPSKWMMDEVPLHFWRREKMKLRSLLMVGALLLGGCAVNPYGDACAGRRNRTSR